VLLVGKCAVCLPCVQAFYNSTRGRRTEPRRHHATRTHASACYPLARTSSCGVQYRAGEDRGEPNHRSGSATRPLRFRRIRKLPLWPPPPALLPATFDSFRRFARARACFLLGRTTYTPIVEQRVKQGFLAREWKLLEFPRSAAPLNSTTELDVRRGPALTRTKAETKGSSERSNKTNPCLHQTVQPHHELPRVP
jgi:hypothetical protein